jgi:hypothetical protein
MFWFNVSTKLSGFRHIQNHKHDERSEKRFFSCKIKIGGLGIGELVIGELDISGLEHIGDDITNYQ